VSARFEELDWCATEMGELSLRRRWDPALRQDVYEVKLDDEYLMSSVFTVAEEELARLGLAGLQGGSGGPGSPALDVLVGGLGLGYTARAVLEAHKLIEEMMVQANVCAAETLEHQVLPTRVDADHLPPLAVRYLGVVGAGQQSVADRELLAGDGHRLAAQPTFGAEQLTGACV